jgi:hypothetical protein
MISVSAYPLRVATMVVFPDPEPMPRGVKITESLVVERSTPKREFRFYAVPTVSTAVEPGRRRITTTVSVELFTTRTAVRPFWMAEFRASPCRAVMAAREPVTPDFTVAVRMNGRATADMMPIRTITMMISIAVNPRRSGPNGRNVMTYPLSTPRAKP